MSKCVLELKNIQQSFKQGSAEELSVLKDINLHINKGETVALVGPSGAGKSTLLHITGLLEKQKSGDIFIDGENVSNSSERMKTKLRRDKIGFVYQYHHLLPEFSALENVMLPQIIQGTKKSVASERAQGFLSAMGLEKRFEHRPAELSGGEQQRVAIARALSNDPSLLLADEPTGNLDPATGDVLFELLKRRVKDFESAALIVTHNMSLATKCDRSYSLGDGIVTEL